MGAGEVRLPQAGQSGLPGKSSVVLEAGRLRTSPNRKKGEFYGTPAFTV